MRRITFNGIEPTPRDPTELVTAMVDGMLVAAVATEVARARLEPTVLAGPIVVGDV